MIRYSYRYHDRDHLAVTATHAYLVDPEGCAAGAAHVAGMLSPLAELLARNVPSSLHLRPYDVAFLQFLRDAGGWLASDPYTVRRGTLRRLERMHLIRVGWWRGRINSAVLM